jgi:CO dehydrogenase/acetyl-CoA synthase beta subunit
VHARESPDFVLTPRHSLEAQKQTQELQIALRKADHEVDLSRMRFEHEMREEENEANHRRTMERWKARTAFLAAWKPQIMGGALVLTGVALVLANHAVVGNGVIGAGISLLAPKFKFKWK